jgi:hypothetical protein
MDYRRICGLVTIATIALTLLIVSIDFQPALGTWWDPGWRYRKTITIDHTKVAANLTNFPLLIDLVDADLASKAKSDGSDIAFVGCCGMQLKHEIEYYNGGTGRLLAWVKLLTLSSTGDQALYMYYGNPSASSQQSPPEVWDSNYRMVQHFEETSGTHYDSTANGRNGTAYGGVVQGTSEKIDGADSFDGSDDYIQVTGQDVVSGTSTTVSFWEKNMTIGSGFGAIFDDFAFSSGTPGFLWQFGDSSTTFQIGNVADWNNRLNYAHGGLTDNIWHYFTVTFGAGAITLYMDGVAVATQISSTSIAIDGESALLMRRSDGHYTKGLLDELTVSDTTRSADWIRTCYNSQNNPSTFYKIGSQEEGGAPIVSDPSPMDGATGVSILLTQLLFDLKDSEEDLMSYTATTSPNIGSGSGTNVPNGTYSISVSGLSRSTIYTWHVNATDGIHWTNVTYRFTTETATYFDPSENGWLYRKKITIDHNRVAAYLSNFPMLVDFTDSALGTNAQADGILLRGCVCQVYLQLQILQSTCTMANQPRLAKKTLLEFGTPVS